MNYLWAVFVITALDGGDYKYTHIETFENKAQCEISATVFVVVNEPFLDNETVECIKVDDNV